MCKQNVVQKLRLSWKYIIYTKHEFAHLSFTLHYSQTLHHITCQQDVIIAIKDLLAHLFLVQRTHHKQRKIVAMATDPEPWAFGQSCGSAPTVPTCFLFAKAVSWQTTVHMWSITSITVYSGPTAAHCAHRKKFAWQRSKEKGNPLWVPERKP